MGFLLPIMTLPFVNTGVVALGTVSVTLQVCVPTVVLPLYVIQVMVAVPLVALLHLDARSGTFHAYDAPTPVAIVVVVPPQVYLSVCVNEEDFLFVFIVSVLPIMTELADTVGTEAL